MRILGYPLGWIMYWLYHHVTNNYAFALLLFTVAVRFVLVPLAIRQQKASVKMAAFKPQIDQINKKYKNNPQKAQEELQQLYVEENFNPMGGCLPVLIQFPILFGLIDVIYRPISHIIRPGAAVIEQASVIAKKMFEDPALSGALGRSNTYSPEIDIIKAVRYASEHGTGAFDALGADFVTAVNDFQFSLFGISLGDIPVLNPADAPSLSLYFILLLVPILSGVTSYILTMFTNRNTAAAADEQTMAMTRSMAIMMPLMSVYIAFKVPVAVGMYWVISNILMMIQTMILYKVMNPQELAQKAIEEMEERRQLAREERRKAKELAKQGDEEAAKKSLSQKEINRQKLAAARKRDAEKYGEEYVDVTDEDLKH